MSVLKYISNFFKNSFSFIKSLFVIEDIFWGGSVNRIIESDIEKGVKIRDNHILFKSKVGFGTYISSNSIISYTYIGKFCSIGPNVTSGWGIHPTNGISTSPAFYSTSKQNGFTYSEIDKIEERKQINIGNDVFIGANVTLLDGVTIGDGAVIGAGAIVSKDIPPYAIAVGSPIKIIKYRFPPEQIDALLSIKWWNKSDAVFKDLERNFYDIDYIIDKYKIE